MCKLLFHKWRIVTNERSAAALTPGAMGIPCMHYSLIHRYAPVSMAISFRKQSSNQQVSDKELYIYASLQWREKPHCIPWQKPSGAMRKPGATNRQKYAHQAVRHRNGNKWLKWRRITSYNWASISLPVSMALVLSVIMLSRTNPFDRLWSLFPLLTILVAYSQAQRMVFHSDAHFPCHSGLRISSRKTVLHVCLIRFKIMFFTESNHIAKCTMWRLGYRCAKRSAVFIWGIYKVHSHLMFLTPLEVVLFIILAFVPLKPPSLSNPSTCPLISMTTAPKRCFQRTSGEVSD